MKVISIVSTQLQLINCAEYMHSTGCKESILFIAAKSQKRERQILEIRDKDCYKSLFSKVYSYSLYSNRLFNFILSFVHIFRLFVFCLLHNYDTCILGNYKEFIGRYLVKKNAKANVIVVDDGLATLAIERGRQEELETRVPFMFIANRVLQKFVEKGSYVPNCIHFYSIFSLKVWGADSYERNKYNYLKKFSSSLNIPQSLLTADIVFLGQPLYFKNFLSEECYSSYLRIYAKEHGTPILYYAHPEESKVKWSELKCGDLYIYTDNVISFEVFASLLKDSTKVVSFYTSALTTIRQINPSIQPEAIYINEIKNSKRELCQNIEKCYGMFRQNGINVIEYDEFNIKDKE